MSNTKKGTNTNLRGQRYLVLVFALFSGWLLSFPFEGKILYALFESNHLEPGKFSLVVMFFHCVGLFGAGFVVRNRSGAENAVKMSLLGCSLLSAVYFVQPSFLWYIALPAAALLGGVCLASFGYILQRVTVRGERFRTVADVLIASNLLMIILNVTTISASPKFVLTIAILFLLIAFLFLGRLFQETETGKEVLQAKHRTHEKQKEIYPLKPLLFLCLFISIVSINSGLMYRVINPAFAHHEWLTVWYWAMPYILMLLFLRNTRGPADRTFFLYIAIATTGLAFLGFMVFDRSVAAYLIVNSLMMCAFGIFDLFWWSVLGEILEDWSNSARIFGMGLGVNVAGILLGGSIAARLSDPSITALLIVFLVLVLLPLLNKQLSLARSDHAFLAAATEYGEDIRSLKLASVAEDVGLTRRESEIASLLALGLTYRMIAAELHLSENTVKTHVKNIYGKCKIQSKAELIKRLLG